MRVLRVVSTQATFEEDATNALAALDGLDEVVSVSHTVRHEERYDEEQREIGIVVYGVTMVDAVFVVR